MMDPVFPPFEYRVQEALRERQAFVRPCPMCASRTWTLVRGVVMVEMFQIAGQMITVSGRLPCVALVCNTCGFVAQYSLVALKLGDAIPK